MSARTPTRLDADREFRDTYAHRWTPAVGDRNPYLVVLRRIGKD
jgi:hypothetical protein